jgi:hypothetical protein
MTKLTINPQNIHHFNIKTPRKDGVISAPSLIDDEYIRSIIRVSSVSHQGCINTAKWSGDGR